MPRKAMPTTMPKGKARKVSPAAAETSNEDYLMAAMALGHTDFLDFFKARPPHLHRSYESLCRNSGVLAHFHGNPLCSILANEPRCCMHVAKSFVDMQASPAGPEPNPAGPEFNPAGPQPAEPEEPAANKARCEPSES